MSNRRSLFSVLVVAVVLGGGCSSSKPAATDETVEASAMVWPLPPDPPRIQYTGEVRGGDDGESRSSFTSRLRNSLLGSKEKDTGIQVQRPFDVHVDPVGRMYVTDGMSPSFIVLEDGERRARTVSPAGPGALAKPMGVGGNAEGDVFIADPVHNRIVAFDSSGIFKRAYGGSGVLLSPVDVALSPTGERVYVVDSYLHQLVIFSESGEVIRRVGKHLGDIEAKESRLRNQGKTDNPHEHGEPSDLVENRSGAPGEFRYPSFVDVAPDGTVYVTDSMNGRIQAFDATGEFLRIIGRMGDTPGSLARPKGVAVDSEGHVYVVDAAFSNVQIFDSGGKLLLPFASLGTGPGLLYMPLGISIDDRDRIFVADRYNNRVQVYQYLEDASATAESVE